MYIRTGQPRFARHYRHFPVRPRALGTEPSAAQTRMPPRVVQVALAIAVGAVAWKLYEGLQERRIEQNLPPWPAIGPLFGSSIGATYALGPFIL